MNHRGRLFAAKKFAREIRNQFLNIPMEATIEYCEATADLIDDIMVTGERCGVLIDFSI
ncbi:hypothetical protein N9219_03820 [bacterium]|nr:hypothetical protein [bacterium]